MNKKGPILPTNEDGTLALAGYKPPISIKEYRQLTDDNTTPDNIVLQRILCLERLCRGVIIAELKSYEE